MVERRGYRNKKLKLKAVKSSEKEKELSLNWKFPKYEQTFFPKAFKICNKTSGGQIHSYEMGNIIFILLFVPVF